APEPLRAVLIAAGLTRYVCNPLMHEGRRLGTLVFATRAHHDTAADAPELVHELGALVAMALARDRAEHALAASAADYHQLFQSVDEGMCTIEMIFDERGQAVDYRFLEVNPMFESQTGLRDAVGHTIRELVPDLDGSWPRIYGEVALTGESRRFENHEPAMHRWFDVYAMRIGDPEDRRVGLLFRDVSDRKNREMSLAFLADLDAELAALSSGEQILNAASQRIAEHLGFFRLIFAEVDEDAETLRVFHEWRDSAVPSGLGVFRIADFVGPGVVE